MAKWLDDLTNDELEELVNQYGEYIEDGKLIYCWEDKTINSIDYEKSITWCTIVVRDEETGKYYSAELAEYYHNISFESNRNDRPRWREVRKKIVKNIEWEIINIKYN